MVRTALYDAENRITSETSPNAVTTTYSYDGDGHRTSKSVGGAAPTIYVYDPAGQMTAEYGTPTDGTIAGTYYLTADSLGSSRLRTDSAGNVKSCYDYLPFGGELTSGIDGRSTSCFASPPGNFNIKFTGKEWDYESSLDYFGARYFSPAQGRFTSADQPFNDQDPDYPQSWNLFSYGRNDPLSNTDPTGMAIWTGTPKDPPTGQSTFGDAQSLLQLEWFILSAGAQQAAHSTFQFLSAPRNTSCLSATTAAGTTGGTAVGAVAGGGVLSLPGAVLGFGIGGTVGWGTGMISCMSDAGEGGGSSGTSEGAETNGAETNAGSAQDKKLSPSEIKKLENTTGETAHQIKAEALGTNKNISQYDLYKDSQGNVLVKGKGGVGEAQPTGLQIN